MLKSLGLVLSGSLAAYASAASVQFDPPDLNLEYQLHKQYMISNGEQPQAAKGIIESYQLQQGENLWGLSQMLYGDGNYWPKVWAQNKSISNPHLIQPGHTLHFQMGSEDDTPSFRFSEAEEPGVELAAAAVTNNPQIEIPPPETPPRPIIQVPKSFPEWQSVYKKRPDRFKIDDSKLLIKRFGPPDKIPLTAYVQEAEIVPSGNFLESEKESGLPVPNQYIYVKIKKGTGQIGQKYLIVMDKGLIRKLNDQVEGHINARFIQVYGDIELTDTAPANFSRSRDRENYEVFRGLILHAISLTMTQYDLIPGQMQIVDMGKVGPEGTASAQILGSMKSHASALYGIGDIVFLNKGSKDGVNEGQIFNVYIDRTIRDSETPVTFATVSSGKIKVVKVSDTVSTGVILEAVDSIQQGDRAQPLVGRSTSAPPPASMGKGEAPPEEGDFDLPADSGSPSDEVPADSGGSDFDLQE
ncbi:MAG: LysM peptidoglycan-binding domain-containing protein [Bdellovibrionales bacterium]